MYTDNNVKNTDNYYEDGYYEDDYDSSNNDNKKGLIIKVVIIVICLIILILLITSLKKNNDDNTAYDPELHEENVSKVRLAAEDYFFIQGNMPKDNEVKKVTLEKLISDNLVTEIVDANKKTCNDVKSYVTLEEDGNVYTLRVNLSCSTNENEEVFYYKKDTYACINCNGKTKMDGKPNKEEEYSIPKEDNYSCTEWSKWTNVRDINEDLIERTREVYLGVKKGGTKEEITYSDWSDYQKEEIIVRDDIEVEITIKKEKDWGEVKTSTTPITPSDTVKVLSSSTTSGGSYTYCSKGYNKENNKCVSETIKNGDLTYNEYVSGDYVILNKPCDALNTEKGKGLVYKNCRYKEVIDLKTGYSSGTVTYTYQEMEEKDVKYYRFRSIKKQQVVEPDTYTSEYYEEKDLPNGYVKDDNSKKIEYSYMLKRCVK